LKLFFIAHVFVFVLGIILEINGQMDPADVHLYETTLNLELDLGNLGGISEGLLSFTSKGFESVLNSDIWIYL
jgi:hypothetical protein